MTSNKAKRWLDNQGRPTLFSLKEEYLPCTGNWKFLHHWKLPAKSKRSAAASVGGGGVVTALHTWISQNGISKSSTSAWCSVPTFLTWRMYCTWLSHPSIIQLATLKAGFSPRGDAEAHSFFSPSPHGEWAFWFEYWALPGYRKNTHKLCTTKKKIPYPTSAAPS